MRRPVWLGCLLLATATFWLSDGPSIAYADALGREVGYRELEEPDVEVFMEVRATPKQLAKVRGEVKRWPTVRRFAVLDQRDAYEVFSELFHDERELVENTDPRSLPRSFRVDLVSRDGRVDFQRRFESLPGVDNVIVTLTAEEEQEQRERFARRARCGGGTPEVEVFMIVNATAQQEAAVESALLGLRGVDSVQRVSHEQAKALFDCLFADDPETVADTAAVDLPVSFRVDVASWSAVQRLLGTIADMPGVDDIAY